VTAQEQGAAGSLAAHVLERCRAEFAGLKRLADGAIAQCSDEDLHHVPAPETNSIAVTIQHLTGNLLSRWTDFLTTDGEKPWRNRDQEFELSGAGRPGLLRAWEDAWAVLFRTIDGLGPDDLLRTVTIRSEPHTVVQALLRQVAHYGYHVGQIVQGARLRVGARWHSLSIPRGGSSAFNQAKGHKA
jgi:hypothetical protein